MTSVAEGNCIYSNLFTGKLLHTATLLDPTDKSGTRVSAGKPGREGRNLKDGALTGKGAAHDSKVRPRRPGRPLALVSAWKAADVEGSRRADSAGTYRHDEFLHTVGGHAVQVGEVQLQMDLVVQHVLAERAAEHGLHRVLGHGVHPQSIHVCVAVLAVWTLIHLQSKTNESRKCYAEAFLFPHS